jgi:hypothetical protein
MPSLIKHLKWFFVDQFMFHVSGGGGGGSSPAPAPSSQTVTNTSIPAYAQPYVETMLGQTSALTDINQNPYQPYGGQRIAEFSPLQQQAFSNVANQQTAGQIGTGTDLASQAGYGGLSAANQVPGLQNQALGYGQMGSMYGGIGSQQAQQVAQQTGNQANLYGGMGAGLGMQASQAGQQYANQATNPYAQQAYMSPYIQNALQPQLAEMQRQYGITGTQEQGRASAAGAFGGTRNSLMQAENERNKNMAMNQAIGSGYQNAFQQAQQAQQFGANLGLQGQQAGIQGAQTGLQGVGAQQAAGNLGLAGTAQGMQGAQAGLAGVQGAVGAGQYGLAGLGTAGSAAGTLGQLGQTQFGQQQAINQAQATAGAVQQAQAQQALDLGYQDFNSQKNYPYQQLAFMSDMLRGLPLSQSAQSQYTAPPNTASQLGGLGMSALGIYGMSGGFKKANGGMVGKGHANGGLMSIQSYKDGGQIGYAAGGDISMLNIPQLQKLLQNKSLNRLEAAAIEDRIRLLSRMQNNPEAAQIMSHADQRFGIGAIGTGDMVPEEVPAGAGGGIIAFAQGGQSEDSYRSFLEKQVRSSIEEQMKGNPFEKTEAEKAKLEQAIAARQERSPYEALAMAGLGTMAGTSQYGLTNLGLGATEGLKSYSKNINQDTKDRQSMLEAQLYADKSEDARKSALTGQMNTTLGQLYAKDAARAAAGAGSEDKALLRVMALINQDDDIPKLIKERDLLGPRDPNYKAYQDAINAIKEGYFKQAGIKRPFVPSPGVQLPPEPEKESFLSSLNPFSSKPAASQNKVVPFSQLPTKG